MAGQGHVSKQVRETQNSQLGGAQVPKALSVKHNIFESVQILSVYQRSLDEVTYDPAQSGGDGNLSENQRGYRNEKLDVRENIVKEGYFDASEGQALGYAQDKQWYPGKNRQDKRRARRPMA